MTLRSVRSPIACALVVALIGAWAPRAFAQGDSAAALALFEDGKRLAGEGKYAEACPKLLASYNLVQKLGTVLNLADCYEKAGKTASAWARFTEGAAMAERAGQKDRADFAREHAAALAPKLSRITINVGIGGAAPPAGLVVKRDGTVVDAPVYGVAVPVDPGPHVIEATAPSKRAWSTTVDVGAAADTKSVEIPPLEAAPVEPVVIPPSTPVTPMAPTSPVAPDTSSGTPGSTQRTWAYVTGGVGAAGVVASVVVGLMASARYDRDKSACIDNGCTQKGLDDRDAAYSLAGVATGVFVVGTLLVGTGVVLYLTAPSAKASPRAAVSVSAGSAGFVGTW